MQLRSVPRSHPWVTAVFSPVAVTSDPVRPSTPETRLLVACVEDAINLVLGRRVASVPYSNSANDRAGARRWIERGNVGLVSFDWVCEVFGWYAPSVRRAILDGRASGRPRRTVSYTRRLRA